MKEQLTFNQWLEKYIPNYRSYPRNGFNDPYPEWWYRWISSGHAEEEKARQKEQAKEWDRREKERLKEEKKFRANAKKKANIPNELSDMIMGIWGESIWKELLDLIVEKQRQELKANKSKEAIRKYITEQYGLAENTAKENK